MNPNSHELSPEIPEESTLLRLIEAARIAQQRAHAPYSGYHVGAALLGEDGRIYAGCNMENASYGLTICAERIAMGSAVSAGVRRPVAIAVITKDGGSPCGACRQVLAEFNTAMTVAIASLDSDKVRVTTVAALLPDHFEL